MTDHDEAERLRRQLRAMSAVNEQLRAQLDATQAEARSAPRQEHAVDPLADTPTPVPVGLAPRRASVAVEWLGQLPSAVAGDRAELVTDDDGALFVLDGDLRRRLRSGLLAAAVEALLGERRPITDDEVQARPEGAPVEVLEGASGLPFVVIGGRRLPVRGLPLPFPVDQVTADTIAVGPELDLPAALAPRRAHDADGWIVASAGTGADTPPRLALAPDGSLVVVDGSRCRPVPSGLLVPALVARLGEATPLTDDDLAALAPAPAVEILEAPAGPPFIVLGGKRTPVVGYPPAYPVRQDRADALPDGPPLDIAGAHRAVQQDLTDQRNIATGERDRADRKLARVQAQLDDTRRREAKRAAAWEANPDPVGELHRLIDKRGGVVPAVASGAARRARRLLRRGSRSS